MHEPDHFRIARFRRLLGWLLAGYWVVLFISTHVPLPDLSNFPQHTDKGVHLFEHFWLAFLLAVWWSARRQLGLRQLGIAFAVLAAYAVIDELLQIPVNRHADIYDVFADWVGSVLGLSTFLLTRKLTPTWWGAAEEAE